MITVISTNPDVKTASIRIQANLEDQIERQVLILFGIDPSGNLEYVYVLESRCKELANMMNLTLDHLNEDRSSAYKKIDKLFRLKDAIMQCKSETDFSLAIDPCLRILEVQRLIIYLKRWNLINDEWKTDVNNVTRMIRISRR